MAISERLPLSMLITRLRSDDQALLNYLVQLQEHFELVEEKVQAFVPESGRFLRLREEAAALIKRFPLVPERPPLFGIPIGVKDIFHVDGFITRAGSRLDSRLLQGAEAPTITRLKEVGALIIGKTVTTEFAYFAPGPTRNPHNLEHTPGGSSSGSAAAVAAGLCPLAFGTQTIGSINRPAAFCGVVGYKPSYDRVDKRGVIPVSLSADHVGLFTPQSSDLAVVAPLISSAWQPSNINRFPVLGVPEGPYLARASAEGLAQFEVDCRRLSEAGFAVVRVPLFDDFDDIYDRHQVLVAAEAAQAHKEWYAANRHLYHPKTAELIERGLPINDQELEQARQGRLHLRDTIGAIMNTHNIDLWLSPPATGSAPKGLASTGDPVMNLPWTHAGLPTVTIPSGTSSNGLPLALQIAGGWYRDEELLNWVILLESNLK